MRRRGSLSTFSLIATLAFAVGVLSGCATRSPVAPSIIAAVSAHEVQGRTATKIHRGQPLDYQDIQHLVRAKVPSDVIIAYLQNTEQSFQFTPGQLDSLRNHGASSQLVNYLEESRQGFYTSEGTVRPSSRFDFRRLWESGFARRSASPSNTLTGEEVIDPAYEESFFSPFFL